MLMAPAVVIEYKMSAHISDTYLSACSYLAQVCHRHGLVLSPCILSYSSNHLYQASHSAARSGVNAILLLLNKNGLIKINSSRREKEEETLKKMAQAGNQVIMRQICG